MSTRWEPAFVAMSALLGEPLDVTLASLGESGAAHAAEVSRKLVSASREARAQAIARVISDVAIALDAARLA